MHVFDNLLFLQNNWLEIILQMDNSIIVQSTIVETRTTFCINSSNIGFRKISNWQHCSLNFPEILDWNGIN